MTSIALMSWFCAAPNIVHINHNFVAT